MQTHGGWISNNKFFTNKIDALRYASSANTNITYYFYDEIWENAVKKNYSAPLDILYKDRAQQLRDKYGYLILNYSAGADSHNILETFTRNKIKLDAIQVKWPVSYSSYQQPIYNTSPFNLLSEWELTVLPCIKDIKKNFPEIQILVEDWCGLREINLTNLEKFNQLLSLGDLFRFSTASTFEKKENTGIIWGIDKPLICNEGSKYGFFFRDTFTSVGQSLFNHNNEYFYWAVDYPDIVVCQAKVLINYFKETHRQHFIFKKDSINQKEKVEVVRQLSIDALYSHKRSVFQVEKYQQENKQDWDGWLYSDCYYSPLVNQWSTQLQNMLFDVDKRFCTLDKDQNKISLLPTNSKVFWIET